MLEAAAETEEKSHVDKVGEIVIGMKACTTEGESPRRPTNKNIAWDLANYYN